MSSRYYDKKRDYSRSRSKSKGRDLRHERQRSSRRQKDQYKRRHDQRVRDERDYHHRDSGNIRINFKEKRHDDKYKRSSKYQRSKSRSSSSSSQSSSYSSSYSKSKSGKKSYERRDSRRKSRRRSSQRHQRSRHRSNSRDSRSSRKKQYHHERRKDDKYQKYEKGSDYTYRKHDRDYKPDTNYQSQKYEPTNKYQTGSSRPPTSYSKPPYQPSAFSSNPQKYKADIDKKQQYIKYDYKQKSFDKPKQYEKPRQIQNRPQQNKYRSKKDEEQKPASSNKQKISPSLFKKQPQTKAKGIEIQIQIGQGTKKDKPIIQNKPSTYANHHTNHSSSSRPPATFPQPTKRIQNESKFPMPQKEKVSKFVELMAQAKKNLQIKPLVPNFLILDTFRTMSKICAQTLDPSLLSWIHKDFESNLQKQKAKLFKNEIILGEQRQNVWSVIPSRPTAQELTLRSTMETINILMTDLNTSFRHLHILD